MKTFWLAALAFLLLSSTANASMFHGETLDAVANGLATALHTEGRREAALITFLVTLSGVVVAGVGSAFWGVLAGSAALFVQQYGRDR